MDRILDSLQRSTGPVLLALIVVVLLMAAATFVMALHARANSARWHSLLAEAEGRSLEHLLRDHLQERVVMEERLEDARERINVLEAKMRSAKRYAGLVRYDAFDDVGGEQSFAVALYDEEGNGALVTSQVGRSDCRVYGKQLVDGRSERKLSSEEERAIEVAANPRARPRISP